jgi:uncharacterized protein YcaQ
VADARPAATRRRGPAITLSLPEARRLAVASQGFGPRLTSPAAQHVRRLANRIHAFQIDSVNVLARAHYVPAFARLGPYRVDALDSLTHDKRELFEYWGHAACLLPIALYSIMRYRMRADDTLEYMRSPRGSYMSAVYTEIAERGPLGASELADPGKRNGKWWGWGRGKAALEHLYDSGLVAISGRRGFQRLYDIAERVIPRSAREAPSPPREEAMKMLICLGAKACGVGTLTDIVGYLDTDGWRERSPSTPWWEREKGSPLARSKPIAKRLVAELVDERRLVPASVDGWGEPAYMYPRARIPRAVHARALVTPFDSLVWDRDRIDRLFGMKYTIELYLPPSKRVFGYYVFPFLLGDTLVARCDVKADRARGVLMVQSAHLEPGQKERRVAAALADELMRVWLGLDRIEVGRRGDLSPALKRARQK